jgi:hypothetical protein
MAIISYRVEEDAKQAYRIGNTDHYLYGLGEAINVYENAMSELERQLASNTSTEEDISNARDLVDDSYRCYILALIEA